MKLRWGVLSSASIAIHKVIPAIQQSERGEVTAIASRELAKAEVTAAALQIPKAYGSYEELLADPDIDAIYVPLPNHLHKEWTIKAAAAGKHVLCEKPIALNAAEAQEIIDACREAGVVYAEAFMYRHHPRYARIREIIASGEIGELRGITGAFTFNNAADTNNVRYHAEWGGGSLYDVGCYPISAARYLLGKEPVAVSVHSFFSEQHDGVDMMSSGIVEFPGDVSLNFDCGMWASDRSRLEVFGTKGRIEVLNPFGPSANDQIMITVNNEQRIEGPYNLNTYIIQIDRFAKVVAGEAEPLVNPDDIRAGMAVIEACLLSARTKTRITL
ncbi:MAG: Gfo/Idh/MocA family protein [Candidatus Pristimantibacillus sp.]